MAAPDPARPSGKRERPSLSGPAGCLSILLSIVIVVVVVWVWVSMINATRLTLIGALLALVTLVVLISFFYGGWAVLVMLPMALYDPIQRLLESARGGPPWYRNPTDIEGYPEAWRNAAAEIHNRIADAFDQEIDTLAQLGIPQPKLLAEPAFALSAKQTDLINGDYVPEELRVTFPKYVVPNHFFYKLIEANAVTGRKACGFLVGRENKMVDIAAKLFEDNPSLALRGSSGVWLSRNPYQLFEASNGYETVMGRLVEHNDWIEKRISEIRPHDPIERAKELSPEEFDRVHWRLDFFDHLTIGTALPFEGKPPAPAWLSDAVVLRIPTLSSLDDRQKVTVRVLPGAKGRPSVKTQFLDGLRCLQSGFAFEIVAGQGTVSLHFTVDKDERAAFVNQLEAYLPDAVIAESAQPFTPGKMRYVQFGLVHSHSLMKSLGEFAVDPYATLLRHLDALPHEQSFCLQVLASPLKTEALRIVHQELERLSEDESLTETVDLRSLHHRAVALNKKLPPWIATLRMYSTETTVRRAIQKEWLEVFAAGDQRLGVLEPKETDGLLYSHRPFSLLSTDELASFVHLPGADVQCERLERTTGTMKAPPTLMTGQGTVIGVNECRGQKTTVVIPEQVRDRHLYIIGKTRTGKSTLMLNLAVQDIRVGKGIGVIDPHGDLIEDLLTYIPKERVQDTVYWDASERSRPIGLNMMEVHTDEEIGMVADDLVVTFRRLSESWGDRMENLLRYVFHTLLNCEDTTFFDVQHILANPARREELIAQLDDPMLIDFWQQQFPKLKDAVQPNFGRMGKFVLTPALSATLGRRESTLNFFDVLQNRKILLVNLAQGKVGEDSARLLGSLIVSQIQLAAMRRAKMRREAREPFNLYVDEFQNFTTSAFDKILSEAGKYKLCLTLAHQYVSQLEDKIRNAILGNAGTILMFPSSAQDASCLRSELGSYSVDDLTDLSAQEHEALCRPPTRSSDTFKLKTFPPPQRPQANAAREVVEHSRSMYGRPIQAQPSRSTQPTKSSPAPTPLQTRPRASVTTPVVAAATSDARPQADTTQADNVIPSPALPVNILPTMPSSGRGGMQHKQLQYLIRNFGEKYGYQATIEKQIMGGAGCVDVAFEKDDISIACQVCVTTGAEYEVKSIQKCLEAGFSAVVLISDNRKTLNKARDLLDGAVPANAANRVRLLPLEDLNAFLAELKAVGQTRTDTVRGRTVKTTFTALPPEQEKAQREAIHQVIAESLRRMGRLED